MFSIRKHFLQYLVYQYPIKILGGPKPKNHKDRYTNEDLFWLQVIETLIKMRGKKVIYWLSKISGDSDFWRLLGQKNQIIFLFFFFKFIFKFQLVTIQQY